MQTPFSSLKPYSRELLRVMKSQKDEENRIAQINEMIKTIYTHVLSSATTKPDTSYQYVLRHSLTNIPDMLSGLQMLFPDCSVQHKTLVRMPDGKLCEMPQIDDKLIPFMNVNIHHTKEECIMIDWS